MELPTTMLFLMLQEISLPVALSVVIPFYFVCIFFSLMEKGCFQNILAIVQHYLVEYIMYISITFSALRSILSRSDTPWGYRYWNTL